MSVRPADVRGLHSGTSIGVGGPSVHGGGVDRLSARGDTRRGMVYVVGEGLWDEPLLAAHFRELAIVAAEVRRRHTRLRVLVDLRAAAVQPPAIAASLKQRTAEVWTEGDRIAVVLQSVLAKMQIERVVNRGNHASFRDLASAEEWLARDFGG